MKCNRRGSVVPARERFWADPPAPACADWSPLTAGGSSPTELSAPQPNNVHSREVMTWNYTFFNFACRCIGFCMPVPLFCSSQRVSPALMCLCSDGLRAKAPSSPPWWASSPPAASAALSRPPLSAAAPPMGAEHLPGPRPHSQSPSSQCQQQERRRLSRWRSRTSSGAPPSSCCAPSARPGRCRPRALSAGPEPGRWDETRPSQRFWTFLLASVLSPGSSLIHLPALLTLQRTGSPEWCQAGLDSQTVHRSRARPSGWK